MLFINWRGIFIRRLTNHSCPCIGVYFDNRVAACLTTSGTPPPIHQFAADATTSFPLAMAASSAATTSSAPVMRHSTCIAPDHRVASGVVRSYSRGRGEHASCTASATALLQHFAQNGMQHVPVRSPDGAAPPSSIGHRLLAPDFTPCGSGFVTVLRRRARHLTQQFHHAMVTIKYHA